MLITIDLEHPENDIEVLGLAEGQTIELRLGPRGYAAYRIFGAAARLLFLAVQDMSKPDIAAATEMMIDRESGFIRQRLDDLRRPGQGGQPSGPQRPRDPSARPPLPRNDRNRGRR